MEYKIPYTMKERLKEIRLTLRYNQQEMADLLSMDIRKLRSYEYETKNLPDDVLRSLSEVLKVNLNWLLTGKGEMFIKECENSKKRIFDDKISEKIKNIGKKYSEIQMANDLTDLQMSALLNISEKDYIKIVRGEKEPDFKILCATKQNFEISIDDLLFGN